MKTQVVTVLLVCALLITLSVAASADLANWVMKIEAYASDGTSSSGGYTAWGWRTGYTDGLDASEDATLLYPPPGSGDALAYVQALNGGSLVKYDYKAPDGVLPKVWTFNIYAKGDAAATFGGIKVTVSTTSHVIPWASLPPGSTLVFAGVYNHVYTAADWLPASSSFTFVVPNGGSLEDPAIETVTLGVPEPGSLAGLLFAVGSLGGAILRRRTLKREGAK